MIFKCRSPFVALQVTEDQWDQQKGRFVRRPVQKQVPVYDVVDVVDEGTGEPVGQRQVKRTREVEVPEQQEIKDTEVRTHEPAREFATNVDELDPVAFSAKVRNTRRLPAIDRLMARKGGKKNGLGETIQSLIETCEVQAVHIEKLLNRIEVLEGSGISRVRK